MADQSNERTGERRFDGLLFLGGGDWWYHNHGHYCMQMVSNLCRTVPVLYVNSIGVRIPRLTEGRMFATRVTRKLRSWANGYRSLSPSLSVLSPVGIPGSLGMRFTTGLIASQVRGALRRMGIERPVAWVVCPPGIEVVERLDVSGLVYQRTDRWEEFPDCNVEQMLDYNRRLRAQADLTLFCSSLLLHEEGRDLPSARFVDHGVDFDQFERAGSDSTGDPGELRSVRRPRVGFIGGIDSHTFDTELFNAVVERLPDLAFVLVGASSLPAGWCDKPNVTHLGRKAYEDVPGYMAACDVLIMPWRDNEWIRACNPVKLKEYLAVGRPVVSRPFAELGKYQDHVAVANTADEFAAAIRDALARPPAPKALRDRVRSETWSARADAVLGHLGAVGLHPADRAMLA